MPRIALASVLAVTLVLVALAVEFTLSGVGLEDATWLVGPSLGILLGRTGRRRPALQLLWVLPTAGFAFLFLGEVAEHGLSLALEEFVLGSRLSLVSLSKYFITLPAWTCVACSAFYELASRLAKARSKPAPLM
jgi:hypothetical protein